MDKENFVEYIKKEIVNGLSILERFKSLKVRQGNYGDGMAVIGAYPRPQINPEERTALKSDLTLWERRVYDVQNVILVKRRNLLYMNLSYQKQIIGSLSRTLVSIV